MIVEMTLSPVEKLVARVEKAQAFLDTYEKKEHRPFFVDIFVDVEKNRPSRLKSKWLFFKKPMDQEGIDALAQEAQTKDIYEIKDYLNTINCAFGVDLFFSEQWFIKAIDTLDEKFFNACRYAYCQIYESRCRLGDLRDKLNRYQKLNDFAATEPDTKIRPLCLSYEDLKALLYVEKLMVTHAT